MRRGLLFFCLMTSAMVCHAAVSKALVRMCEKVEIAAETVRLSDFLPAEVDPPVWKKSEAIILGKSPLLGSTRTFTSTEVLQALNGHADLLQELSIPQRIATRRVGWPVPMSDIQHAVSDYMASHDLRADEIAVDSLKLPGNPVAVRQAPGLTVVRMERDRFHKELRFTLRCRERNECMPFFATLHEREDFSATLQTRPASVRSSGKRSGECLLRAGNPAMLDIHDGQMHISLLVICLDRGCLGQTIRVRDAAGQKIYKARVVSGSAVEADL